MPEPVTPQGETAAQVTPEPSAAPQPTGSSVTPEPVKEQAPAAEPKAVDAGELQKQLEKLQMENNLHKNKLKEYDAKAEEARKAEMTEIERLQEEVNEFRSKESRRESENFRNEVIEEFLANDPAALKAAKALIAKNPANLVWGDGEDGNGLTADEAKADLIGQLEALKEAIGSSTPAPSAEAPSPAVHANNPGSANHEPTPDRVAAIRAASESGDWSKVLGDMDTVKFQKSQQY